MANVTNGQSLYKHITLIYAFNIKSTIRFPAEKVSSMHIYLLNGYNLLVLGTSLREFIFCFKILYLI